MKQYRAVEGDRLDIVVFKAYGSINSDVMQAVLDENEELLKSSILTAGDVVLLPEIEVKEDESQSQALWS